MGYLSQSNGTPLWTPFIYGGSVSWSGVVISSSTIKGGAQGRATKTGTITQIGVWVSAISGSPTIDARIESIGTNLIPTGTLLGTGSNKVFSPVAGSLNIVTLDNPVSVTVGDQLATVLSYVSGTSATVQLRSTGGIVLTSPSAATMSAGSWTLNSGGYPCIVPIYDDGQWMWQNLAGTNDDVGFSDASNPDEYGNCFTAPIDCVCVGAQFAARDNGTGTFEMRLYDSSGTLLGYSSHATTGATNPYHTQSYWSSPVNLTGGQQYYLTMKATNSNSVAAYGVRFGSNGAVKTWMDAAKASRNNGGAWTTDNTRLMTMVPLVTSLSGGSGGGVETFSGHFG